MKRAMFLDRDGVINVDHGYVGKIADFHVIPGVFDALATVKALDYMLIVVTNQSGIARGYFSDDDYRQVERHMIGLFTARGISLAGVYHCPHHPGGTRSELSIVCGCRKPAPGMILRASTEHAIDLPRSILVGDKPADVETGEAAGVGHSFLVGVPDADGIGRFASLAQFVASPTFRDIG